MRKKVKKHQQNPTKIKLSWWDKYHNHVYGLITIVGVVLSVIFFIMPNGSYQKAKLKLIDVSKDEQVSKEITKTIFGNFEFENVKYDYDKFSGAVDFKFLNEGSGTAFLTRVEIEIIESKLNEAPNLHFSYFVENGNLIIKANNTGWGYAKIKEVKFKKSILDHFIKLTDFNPIQINSNSNGTIFEISNKFISKKLEKKYKDSFLERKEFSRLVHYHVLSEWKNAIRINEYYMSEDDIEEDNMSVEVMYFDKFNNELRRNFHIEPSYTLYKYGEHGGQLWWTPEGFIFEPLILVMNSSVNPKTIYSVILSPDDNSSKIYPISHYIKSQEPERFHFYFVSKKSATYKLRFHFTFNGNNIISSEPIILEFVTETDQHFHNFIDGKMLTFEDGEIKLNASEPPARTFAKPVRVTSPPR